MLFLVENTVSVGMQYEPTQLLLLKNIVNWLQQFRVGGRNFFSNIR